MNLNFIPSYGAKIRTLAYGLLVAAVLCLVASKFTKLLPISTDLALWAVAFALLLISFSKGKREPKNSLLIRYYAGKIVASFAVCFLLALKLASFVTGKSFPVDTLMLVVVVLATYQVLWHLFVAAEKKGGLQLQKAGVPETLASNKKLLLASAVLAALTLAAILLFG